MILFLILDYASLNIKFCQGEKLMKILIIKDNKIPKINLENLLNTLITVCLDPFDTIFSRLSESELNIDPSKYLDSRYNLGLFQLLRWFKFKNVVKRRF